MLSWIRSDHRKYHQFVAFRVSEFIDLTEIQEWNWKLSRWFSGPEFLKYPEDTWPVHNMDNVTTEIELKHSVNTLTVREPLLCITRFSRWSRALRTIAFVIKFVNFRKKDSSRSEKELTQNELYAAEVTLLKEAQNEYYGDEIYCLLQEKALPKSSSIYKL